MTTLQHNSQEEPMLVGVGCCGKHLQLIFHWHGWRLACMTKLFLETSQKCWSWLTYHHISNWQCHHPNKLQSQAKHQQSRNEPALLVSNYSVGLPILCPALICTQKHYSQAANKVTNSTCSVPCLPFICRIREEPFWTHTMWVLQKERWAEHCA